MTQKATITWCKATFDKVSPKAWKRINRTNKLKIVFLFQRMHRAQVAAYDAADQYKKFCQQFL
jgi:hypothetical protein